jgi:predicted nucleic acid-binding protein
MTVVRERVPFSAHHASLAAKLFNDSGRRRGSMIDCMIAAVAVGEDVPIATANQPDFARFEANGLTLA